MTETTTAGHLKTQPVVRWYGLLPLGAQLFAGGEHDPPCSANAAAVTSTQENKNFKRYFNAALGGAPSPEPLLGDPGVTRSQRWGRRLASSSPRATMCLVKIDPRHEG